jgi:L-galactonate 5-dehydrogenase
MDAKALITREDQSFAIEDVKLPEVKADEIGIRVQFSGVSIGTEFALIRQKLKWADFPICTGYMATGIVDKAGSAVKGFKVGDRVFARGNPNMTLKNGTKVGCVEAGHASYIVRNPDGMEGCGIVPESADMAAASMYVMPAVALNGLAQAQPEATDMVLVYGTGLIGLGAVALAVLRGCEVIAVDINDRALKLAKAMGADHTVNASDADWREQVKAIVPNGADCVIEATGVPACVDTAFSLCRGRGKFVWQGNYGAKPITYQFMAPHGRQVQAFYPSHDGQLPFRKRVMKLMASGALQWERCITHRVPWQKSAEAFERINKGDQELVGVVLDWR